MPLRPGQKAGCFDQRADPAEVGGVLHARAEHGRGARRRAHEPEQHRHRGRLARAVRPDEACDDAGRNLEAQRVDREPATVPLGETVRGQRRRPPAPGPPDACSPDRALSLCLCHPIFIANLILWSQGSWLSFRHEHRARPSRAKEAADAHGDQGRRDAPLPRAWLRPGQRRRVARAADVSEATVFNYFPTKEDLVYERMDAFEQELLAAVRERPEGESVLRAFVRFILDRSDSAADGRRQAPGGRTHATHDRQPLAAGPGATDRRRATPTRCRRCSPKRPERPPTTSSRASPPRR